MSSSCASLMFPVGAFGVMHACQVRASRAPQSQDACTSPCWNDQTQCPGTEEDVRGLIAMLEEGAEALLAEGDAATMGAYRDHLRGEEDGRVFPCSCWLYWLE